MANRYFGLLLLLLAALSLAGCYRIKKSAGGGQRSSLNARRIDPSGILLPPGYRIEAVASGFTFPTDAVFDEAGNLFVLESGYSYGEVFTAPRLLKIDASGKPTVVAAGTRNGPWTGVEYHEGNFYVAEGGTMEGGRILRITSAGNTTVLISNLPSFGDHHTNGPMVHQGFLYFTVGTATNSGVVGPDNAHYGWLKRKPDFHDIACRDLILSGQNYSSDNALTETRGDTVRTGAFVPYGTATTPGQVIRGQIPCTGAVLRMPIGGGNPELVAWGLRNPFGLAKAPDGRLFTTENGYDERGSRPIWGAGDVLWEVQTGAWYGFPDYSAGKRIASDEEFGSPKEKPRLVKPILQQDPAKPPKPAAIFGVHASANGFDFSRSDAFGFSGEAFVAQFGDMAPEVGKVWAPVGFKVVRVNTQTGVIRDFAVNKGKRNGPASWLGNGGLERPMSVVFNREGTAMYVVDFGAVRTDKTGTHPQQAAGVIWKISKQ